MPTTLEKTRKHIAKKKGGDVTSLHVRSRNSFRLINASVRDQRLNKLAMSRCRREQPIVDRASYFKEAVQEKGGVLSIETIQELIHAFIHRFDGDLDELKKARRPGRPATTREDILRLKVEALQKEHEQGFVIPDVTNEEAVKNFSRWEGSWAYLNTVSWIKITTADKVRTVEFPSKGLN